MIRPLFDAVISAFHVHNEPAAMGKAIERLVARGRGDALTLAQLLTDEEWDLLGPRNLVAPYRGGLNTDGVKRSAPPDRFCGRRTMQVEARMVTTDQIGRAAFQKDDAPDQVVLDEVRRFLSRAFGTAAQP